MAAAEKASSRVTEGYGMTALTVAISESAAPRVCILTESFYPLIGGGETQARLLAESLITRGFSTIVLTRRTDQSLKRQEDVGAISVHRLAPIGRPHWKKWGLLLSAIPALVRLRKDYDVILVSGFRVVGVAAVLVTRLFGKACVLKADSNGEMSGEFFTPGLRGIGIGATNPIFRMILAARNWMLRRADAFIAISSDIRDELQLHGVDEDKIVVSPNCVDTGIFQPVTDERRLFLRSRLGLPKEGTVVIYTGRLVSYKGLPLLLRVWKRLTQAKTDLTLMLVGDGSMDIHNCEAQLREYCQVHGLEESVVFTGAVNDVETYLQASDIFVMPTEEEAFGLSVVEAMACGLPVVTTDVGGLAEIVSHEKSGLQVNPGEFGDLYEALLRLTEDPTLANRLGREARKSAVERYSAQSVTQRYVDLFSGLAN